MATPVITLFVRHAEGCKYGGDETAKRCNCKKHFRWTLKGKQYRQTAGTRSWAEAEEKRRELADELAGRTTSKTNPSQNLQGCIDVFIQDKRVQGVSEGVIQKYARELERLRKHCDRLRVQTVRGITRDLLTGFCATWEAAYPSTVTRAKARERLRSFLRYCYEAEWLERIPPVPKFKIDEPETQPLTPDEYARLLEAVFVTVEATKADNRQREVYAFLQTMRWTGLAIRDAMTLRRDALERTPKGLYRVTTKRQKTGTPVSVPIPNDVAKDLLALPVTSVYFFWSGAGKPQSAVSNWGQRYIAPVFKAAGIVSEGNMLSHRLRDTFAVDLLEKGVPMEEVSKLLGHTSIRTTEKHYAKWSKGRQERADQLVAATWT